MSEETATTTTTPEPTSTTREAQIKETLVEIASTWASFGLGVAGDALERFAAQQVRLGEALRKTGEALRKVQDAD
ncbi:MAG: hypothetical protein HOO96_04185 [Polyangiaceae bacterium]|nr:hypothetical protein [Polyangiaceae bacterium]